VSGWSLESRDDFLGWVRERLPANHQVARAILWTQWLRGRRRFSEADVRLARQGAIFNFQSWGSDRSPEEQST